MQRRDQQFPRLPSHPLQQPARICSRDEVVVQEGDLGDEMFAADLDFHGISMDFHARFQWLTVFAGVC